jgi:hypothetical protein
VFRLAIANLEKETMTNAKPLAKPYPKAAKKAEVRSYEQQFHFPNLKIILIKSFANVQEFAIYIL